ncbi:MAG: hypothetical protein ABI639_04980 [Thermoanaerobaculia bacterium]
MRRLEASRRYQVVAALALFAGGGFARAQSPAAATPCSAAQYRQFDFWLGEWEVDAPGSPPSKSRISPIFGACGIREEYSANSGNFLGTSLSTYDAARKIWRQAWVDNKGGTQVLEGGMRGGAMVLEGRKPRAQGGEQVSRLTWTANADGTVRQHWEVSTDDGKTWTTAFDGHYRHTATKGAIAKP